MSNPSESTSGIMATGNGSNLEQDQFVEKQQLQSSSSQSQPLQFSSQPEPQMSPKLHETLATQNLMDVATKINDIQTQDTIKKMYDLSFKYLLIGEYFNRS